MSDRGTGRTTRQMQDAPKNAYFVHPGPAHARYLADRIGRQDLKIVTPEFVTRGCTKGLRPDMVVTDHYILNPD